MIGKMREAVSWMVLELLWDDGAQAMVEYGIIATAFAILGIGAMIAIQQSAGATLNSTQNNLSSEYLNP